MSSDHALWKRLSSGPRDRQALVFLRLMTGLFFLYQGYQKYNNPQFLGSLPNTLQQWTDGNPIFFYQAFLQHVAIPHATVLGKLVMYGEMAIGISLITGCLIQFSTIAAMWMNLNFLLATQHLDASFLYINAVFMVISFTLYWGRAGQYYGLDGLLFKVGSGGSGASVKSSSKPKSGKGSKKLNAAIDMLSQSQKGGGKEKPPKSGGKKKSKFRNKPF